MGANSVLSRYKHVYMYCYEKELKTPMKLTVNNEQRPQTTSYTGMMESRVYHRSFYMLHCWEQGLKFIPAVKEQFATTFIKLCLVLEAVGQRVSGTGTGTKINTKGEFDLTRKTSKS